MPAAVLISARSMLLVGFAYTARWLHGILGVLQNDLPIADVAEVNRPLPKLVHAARHC